MAFLWDGTGPTFTAEDRPTVAAAHRRTDVTLKKLDHLWQPRSTRLWKASLQRLATIKCTFEGDWQPQEPHHIFDGRGGAGGVIR